MSVYQSYKLYILHRYCTACTRKCYNKLFLLKNWRDLPADQFQHQVSLGERSERKSEEIHSQQVGQWLREGEVSCNLGVICKIIPVPLYPRECLRTFYSTIFNVQHWQSAPDHSYTFFRKSINRFLWRRWYFCYGQKINPDLRNRITGVFSMVFRSRPRKSSAAYTAAPNTSGEEAVKKFGNAKSISSDMFFGNENQVPFYYQYS